MTASTYGWAITYDHLDKKRDWITGPRNISPEMKSILAAAAKAGRGHADKFPGVEWFRIYDDDQELYYTGLRVGESEPFGTEDGFEPLYDFGIPAAGATEVRYLDPATAGKGSREVWVTL